MGILDNIPNIWPVISLIKIHVLSIENDHHDSKVMKDNPKNESQESFTSKGLQNTATELFARHLRLSTYLILAMFTYYVLPYPDILAVEMSRMHVVYWAPYILVRNIVMVGTLYGGWHYFLYENKAMREKMRSRKFDERNLDKNGNLIASKGYNWKECAFWSISGIIIESLYECVVLQYWITTKLVYTQFWSRPIISLVSLLFVAYWRDFHFYFAHRVMHPYFSANSKWKKLDLGRFLYRHAHSLHHKSYNTGPWSGLSMHPIEHLVYFSCVFIPSLIIPQHPIAFLYNHFHVLVSPLPGHDGYDDPAGGSKFHFLHHAHFDVNFGTPMVPLDRLFGSYDDGSRYKGS